MAVVDKANALAETRRRRVHNEKRDDAHHRHHRVHPNCDTLYLFGDDDDAPFWSGDAPFFRSPGFRRLYVVS